MDGGDCPSIDVVIAPRQQTRPTAQEGLRNQHVGKIDLGYRLIPSEFSLLALLTMTILGISDISGVVVPLAV